MIFHKLTTRRTGLVLALLAALYGSAAIATDTDSTASTPATPAVAPMADANGAKTMEAVSVVAVGQTRQIQSISAEDIKAAPPGTSALKVLNELPGVNFQSSDPWGAYEWSTQITLHGFDQSRLGFTLDGIRSLPPRVVLTP